MVHALPEVSSFIPALAFPTEARSLRGMHRQPLLDQLAAYQAAHPTESETVAQFIGFVRSQPECFERTLAIGHITGSAWIVKPDGSEVLLTHHRKLDRWLQLGGHADGDWFLLRSALRECTEETGLKELYLLERAWGSPLLPFFVQHFQLKPFGSTPAHEHYDAVFAFQALKNEVIYDASESDGIRWVSAASLQQQVDRQCGMNDGISLLTAKLCLKVLQ